MASSYQDYYYAMKNAQWTIGLKLGVDTKQVDFQSRVMNACTLAMITALVKTLSDLSVLPATFDAALTSHLSDVTAFNWDPTLI